MVTPGSSEVRESHFLTGIYNGLPLAIELAAARIRLFPPHALLHRLDSRLKLLTGGARDRPERQQTLRGAIDWSYSLLTIEEQVLFARLSVFVGGCTVEAAEEVCDLDGSLPVLEGLSSLVEQNLLGQVERDEPRLVMLETIREYAAERLEEGRAADVIQRAHASYFVGLADEARASFEEGVSPTWLDRLAREHDNLRATLSWLLAQAESDQALLLLVGGLWRFWWIRGLVREGRTWLDAVLARTTDSISAERAIALRAASHLAMEQSDLEQARALANAAVDLARQVGNMAALGDVLMTQGLSAQMQGDSGLARRSFEESLVLARELGRMQRAGIVMRHLAQVAQQQGDIVQATKLLQESVVLHQQQNDARSLMRDFLSLGELVEQQHEPEQAEALFRESLSLGLQFQEIGTICHLLDALARLAARRTEHLRAAYLLASAGGLRETLGIVLGQAERELRDACLVHVQTDLGDTWNSARQAGQAMSLEEAVTYALGEREP